MSNKKLNFILILIALVSFSCQPKTNIGKIKIVKPEIGITTQAQFDSLEKANRLIGKKYIIVDSAEHSDFNYTLISKFDSLSLEIDSSEIFFKPVAGDYKYFKFLATQKGWSLDNTIKDFHDVLIVKTNKEGFIEDAFQYTLEWGEYPFTSDLYKLTNKGVRLTNKLKIDSLKMQNVDRFNKIENLSDEGVLFLKPKSR